MFDSPFEFCKLCREYVLLDQTQTECAREHHCADAAACPLRRFFTGIEFTAARHEAPDAGHPRTCCSCAPSRPAVRRRKS